MTDTQGQSLFSHDDPARIAQLLKHGAKLATHTTYNQGVAWELPSPDPKVYDQVARKLASVLKEA